MARRDRRGVDLSPRAADDLVAAETGKPGGWQSDRREVPGEESVPGRLPGRSARPGATGRPSGRVPARIVARRRVVIAAVVAILLVAGSVMATWLAYGGDEPEGAADEAPAAVSGGYGVLLAVVDGEDRVASIGVLARSNEGDPNLVLVPPALEIDLPGFGLALLSEATRYEGPELAELALMNELGIRIDYTIAFGPGELAALIGGPIEVEMPSPLIVEEGVTARVLVAEETNLVPPDTAEAVLSTQGQGSQLEWLDRQRAVWKAVLARWQANPDPLLDQVAARGAVTVPVQRVLEGAETVVTALPVSRLGVGGGTDIYVVARPDGNDFVDQVLGFLVLRTDRPRVEILNGSGRVGTTRPIAGDLIREGFRVVRTDNADRTTYRETLVIAQGADHSAVARQVRDVLGIGEVVLQDRAASSVVDVSVIVGSDLATQVR